MYAGFDFYSNTYGGDMTAEEYSVFGARASEEIDRRTFGRAKTASDAMAEPLKWACAKSADILRDLKTSLAVMVGAGGGAIQSENTDGYTVSYRDVTPQTIKLTANNDIDDVLSDHLTFPDNLMFMGVRQ